MTITQSADANQLEPSGWSPAVALDPKHRPQTLDQPSTTVRREWLRWPQEAHLLDAKNNRYRRLTVAEIARIQGFDETQFSGTSLPDKDLIAGLGNAVPPPLAEAVFDTINKVWEWEDKSVIEICAGFGGLANGLTSVDDFKHHALLEFWEPACEVLRQSSDWESSAVQCVDVKTFDFKPFKGEVGLLTGGPPCQPWSQAGNNAGKDDPRDVLGHVPKMIAEVEPEVFVFENVPGLSSSKEHSKYFENLLDQLSSPRDDLEYGVAAGILNAADYGVPQRRRRLFIIGFKNKSFTFATAMLRSIQAAATHANPKSPKVGRKDWVTIGEAFEGLEDPGGWRIFLNDRDQLSPAKSSSEDSEEPRKLLIPDHRTDDTDHRKSTRIQFSWPGENQRVKVAKNGKFSLVPAIQERHFFPLLESGVETENEELRVRQSSYVKGDIDEALSALIHTHKSSVELAYWDVPRIDFFESSAEELKRSTWLTLLKNVCQRVLPILTEDGVFVVHVDDESAHLTRIVMESVFGARNYASTLVWQKKYGPQNDLNIPTDAQDYLICFAKNIDALPVIGLPVADENLKDDGDPRGPFRAMHKGARSGSKNSRWPYFGPPYRWQLVSGSLPDGIWRINPQSGVIWGTPKKSGATEFTVRVTDADGNSTESLVQMTVKDSGGTNNQDSVWWLEDEHHGSGPLKIKSVSLPDGVVGLPYSAVLEASGGTAFKPNRQKPGSGRYWEFSKDTLSKAILEDSAWFGRDGKALPSRRNYVDTSAPPRTRRVTTWIPYEVGGKAEDATKHLAELSSAQLVDGTFPRIAKPERLMKLIIQLFTRAENSWVLDISSPAASFSAASIKMKRRFIYLEFGPTDERSQIPSVELQRLCRVVEGKDNSPHGISNDEDIAWTGGGEFKQLEVGAHLLTHHELLDYWEPNLEDYPMDSAKFRNGIMHVAGFVPRQTDGLVTGVSIDGSEACVFLPPGDSVNDLLLGQIAEQLVPNYTNITVLFERTASPSVGSVHESIKLQTYPHELVG